MSFFISYPLSALGHISSLLPVGFWADKGYEMKNAMCNNLYVYTEELDIKSFLTFYILIINLLLE